jgi:hypothetical protein
MSEERSAETILWDLTRGGLTARVLGLVAELGIADALSEGPRHVDELARESGASADMLHRSLRALASDGVFAEDEPGVFRNTDASELLRRTGTGRSSRTTSAGSGCAPLVELDPTGEPCFERDVRRPTSGRGSPRPAERAPFDRAMAAARTAARPLASVEWRDGETVVDVGGGNGALLRRSSATARASRHRLRPAGDRSRRGGVR